MIYYFAIGFSIIFILFILNLVIKNKLDEKYSILWLLFSFIILIISIFPSIIEYIATLFGVYYAPALMLLFSILVIGAYIIHIIIIITKQNKMIIKLTQEVALLKDKIVQISKKEK